MTKEKVLTSLHYLLILLCGLGAFYLSCNIVLFSKTPSANFELWQIIIVAILVLGLFATIITINIKRKLYKPNYVIIGLISILFIINMINVLLYKNDTVYNFISANKETNYSVTMAFSTSDKAVAIISFLGTMLGALLLFDIIHQVSDLKTVIKYLCFVIIAAAIVFIIIGLVRFPNRYFLLYKHLTDEQLYHASIPSIFETKNEYGLVLYLAVLAGIYLHYFYRKWYWLLGSFYAYVNIVHTLSKQMIIIGALTMMAYLICIFFTTFNKHKKMNVIALASIGGIILLAIVVGMIYLGVTNKFQALVDTIYYTKGNDTFKTRIYIWDKTLTILNANNWGTGVGHILFGEVLHKLNLTDITSGEAAARYSAHSAYLQYIGEGGIVFLLAELIVIGYSFYLGIKFFKQDKELIVLSLSVIALFLVIMFFESASIGFAFTLDYAVITLFTISVIIDLARKNNKIFLYK